MVVYLGRDRLKVAAYGLGEDLTKLYALTDAGLRRAGTARREAKAGTRFTLKLVMWEGNWARRRRRTELEMGLWLQGFLNKQPT